MQRKIYIGMVRRIVHRFPTPSFRCLMTRALGPRIPTHWHSYTAVPVSAGSTAFVQRPLSMQTHMFARLLPVAGFESPFVTGKRCHSVKLDLNAFEFTLTGGFCWWSMFARLHSAVDEPLTLQYQADHLVYPTLYSFVQRGVHDKLVER